MTPAIIHCLIRHAHAEDGPDDAGRPLSDLGREQARQLGELLAREKDFQPAEIWHSPLLRARETAELLVAALGREVPLRLRRGLEPEGDPQITAAALRASEQPVALVGHEPHLSALAATLLHPTSRPHAIAFPKAAAMAATREGSAWRVRWLARVP